MIKTLFKIDSTYKTNSSTPLIERNKTVFHFDEFPILFAGINKFGNKIIGSFIEEDENFSTRYLHLNVTDEQYSKFIKQKISYTDLIRESDIYIIDLDVNEKIKSIYSITVDLIPSDYMPSENVLCPNVKNATGSIFSISLKGLDADVHEAMVDSVSTVTKRFEKILDLAMSSITDLKVNYNITERVPVESSYKINLALRITDSKQTALWKDPEKIYEYVSNFIKFSLNGLLNESDKLLSKSIEGTDYEKNLLSNWLSIHKDFQVSINDEKKEKLLEKTLESAHELEEIADVSGKGFNGIEVFVDTNEMNPLGFLNEKTFNEISTISENIILKNSDTETDDEYKTYNIWIYHLNTDTRSGNAHILNFNNEAKEAKTDSPKIKIDGDEDIKNSIFTESLHQGKWIDVMAKATKSKGKFKLLRIDSIK